MASLCTPGREIGWSRNRLDYLFLITIDKQQKVFIIIGLLINRHQYCREFDKMTGGKTQNDGLNILD